MASPPRLIIFDYDGVVADSEILNNRALADVLTEAGLPTTTDDVIARYMGKRWIDFRDEIGQRLPGAELDQLLASWTRLCRQRALTDLRSVPGVTDFVASLGDRPRCIASSSKPDWIDFGLQHMGLTGQMGPVFSAAVHVTRGKPHPDLFLYAADHFGTVPDACLVIEDSPTGVMGAVAAGMRVIGLAAGGHVRDDHADRLLGAGAHEIAHSYEEVAAIRTFVDFCNRP